MFKILQFSKCTQEFFFFDYFFIFFCSIYFFPFDAFLVKSMQVPWDDLRYLFGEIMYGGHITDVWDRRLSKAYLQEFLNPNMVGQP